MQRDAGAANLGARAVTGTMARTGSETVAHADMMQPVRCVQKRSDGSVVHSQVTARVLVNEACAGLVSTASDYVGDEMAQGPILADLLRDRSVPRHK
jgi:hypothetical protein